MSTEFITLRLLRLDIGLSMCYTRPCFRMLTRSHCVRANDAGAKGPCNLLYTREYSTTIVVPRAAVVLADKRAKANGVSIYG